MIPVQSLVRLSFLGELDSDDEDVELEVIIDDEHPNVWFSADVRKRREPSKGPASARASHFLKSAEMLQQRSSFHISNPGYVMKLRPPGVLRSSLAMAGYRKAMGFIPYELYVV